MIISSDWFPSWLITVHCLENRAVPANSLISLVGDKLLDAEMEERFKRALGDLVNAPHAPHKSEPKSGSTKKVAVPDSLYENT